MTAADILNSLLSHGPIGLIAAVAFYLYVQKDRELAAERKARVDDATQFRDVALKIQERVIAAVEAITKIAKGGS